MSLSPTKYSIAQVNPTNYGMPEWVAKWKGEWYNYRFNPETGWSEYWANGMWNPVEAEPVRRGKGKKRWNSYQRNPTKEEVWEEIERNQQLMHDRIRFMDKMGDFQDGNLRPSRDLNGRQRYLDRRSDSNWGPYDDWAFDDDDGDDDGDDRYKDGNEMQTDGGSQKRFRKSRRHNKRRRTKKSRKTKRIR